MYKRSIQLCCVFFKVNFKHPDQIKNLAGKVPNKIFRFIFQKLLKLICTNRLSHPDPLVSLVRFGYLKMVVCYDSATVLKMAGVKWHWYNE